MSPNSLLSFPTCAKTPVQNRPTPEISITAGLMAIILLDPAETAKKPKTGNNKGTTKADKKGGSTGHNPN